MNDGRCFKVSKDFKSNSFVQAAIDQLLETETLDLIVDSLANGDFCANLGIGTLLIPENVDGFQNFQHR